MKPSTALRGMAKGVRAKVVQNALNNSSPELTFGLQGSAGFAFPSSGFPFYVVAWDELNYEDPTDDPNVRIGLATHRTSTAVTVKWGRFDTSTAPLGGTPTITPISPDRQGSGLCMMLEDFAGRQQNISRTVGLQNADSVYSADMAPLHYSDAVNEALGQNSGEVTLQGETVNFTSASGKVVVPVSNKVIRGSGIGRTVINTTRTDYVFKNTINPIANATLSDMTIDCQDLPSVSGIDIRKFTNYRLERVEFKRGTQWFARFGNEPSASTSEINQRLLVQDCTFDDHDGIYEMLLVYNTDYTDINRCIFSNKTGSAGAAPTLGIWQKANGIRISNSLFKDLVSSAIYYAYSTHRIAVYRTDFINTGQALRGANVADNGKFGEKTVNRLDVDHCNMLGGSNSLTTEAIQVGSVDDFSVTNTTITNYAKGIRIGFGNSVPTAADGGSAYYPSYRGRIDKVTFENINSNANSKNLNSPIYFANGGDFGDLTISRVKIKDPSNYLDYAVIFNGMTTATATLNAGAIASITVTNTTAWYSAAPTVTITGNGTGATATANIDVDGRITGITVTNGGSGYTSATVSIAGANYKNITFVDCDFGGKQIRINDGAQLDLATVKFINCRNLDTSNLSAAMAIIDSSNSLTVKRLTSTQRDAITAANGMVIYNTTTNKFQGYENGAWANLI